jgi:carbon-monoxide dehydrogenase medium subunit
MKPSAFDYVRPATLREALDIRDAMPIAGGQSLLPLLALRMNAPELVLDISRLPELRRVEDKGAYVLIGAAITHAEIEDGIVPDPGRGLMRRIAAHIAYRAIRNQGTIGGSVAMADPAADWPLALMALNATAVIAGASGERREAVSEFIQDVYTTSLAAGEIVVAFEIPRFDAGARSGVFKVARKSGAFAMSQAIAVVKDGGADDRVYLSGADNRAIRLAETSALIGTETSESVLRASIAHDLAATPASSDAYALRLHTAVALRAIQETHAS